MKKYLIIILMLAMGAAYAPNVLAAGCGPTSVPGIGGGVEEEDSWPDFTYDIWIDYETEAGTDCGGTHLEATDNSASSYTYTSVDASSELNCRDTSAKKNGTQGFSYDYTAGAVGYTQIVVSDTSVSGGFWFYGPDMNNWTRLSIVNILKGSGDYGCRISWIQDSGAEILEVNGTSSEDNTSLSHSTWYWITFKAVKNDQCYVTVYDTDENTVGSELSPTFSNEDVTGVRWGGVSHSGSKAVTSYIDDFCLDITDYTYPLGTGQ